MLEQYFHELNAAHFYGSLPLPKLRWNPRLTSTAGRFSAASRRLIHVRPPEIEVASYLQKMPDGERHVRDTILHEMIHYFLWHEGRPHGHTAEFHAIMKKVGAKRYNDVPLTRPVKYQYECPNCRKQVPARRRLRESACADCCQKFSHGYFDRRFLLRIADAKAAPVKVIRREAPAMAPSEIVRRLEELKQMLKKRF